VTAEWIVVVPFRSAAAKSRFGPHDNSALALAMALDTVEVAVNVARVIVVTDAPQPFLALGAAVHPDPGAGLNAAIEAGLAQAGIDSARAVLLGDHPALTHVELVESLAAATHPLSVVTDSAGTGTALTAALPGVSHHPAFGENSRAAHEAAGYLPLVGEWPGLRADVDTAADLARLERSGPRTAAWSAGSRC
jgi:2-phospho-L-lactate/phosphoenolpyruvate guanylyltransferase